MSEVFATKSMLVTNNVIAYCAVFLVSKFVLVVLVIFMFTLLLYVEMQKE